MSQPKVNTTLLDGALGVLPPTAGKIFALAGVSSSGPVDTPATFSRKEDIVSTFGIGPLVEAACHFVELYGRPVALVRTGQTTAGAFGTPVDGVAGTSAITLDTPEPDDDFDLYLEFIAGGTVGTSGITYRYSLDGGRTMSATIALGTANAITFPDTGGVTVDLGAGTIVAGDTWAVRTTAPQWNATELGTALDALRDTAINWGIVHIVGALDGTLFDTVESAIAGMAAKQKYRAYIGHFRMPNEGESEATYLAAFDTAFGNKSTTYGQVCAGAVKLTSSVSRRKFRRPSSFVIAARQASVSSEVNIAAIEGGPIRGVSIRDANGNPDEHDETVNPGLDDARACVLRTWSGRAGVYVNRPILLYGTGSDFQIMPHRLVMNEALEVLVEYYERRLNKPILVDKTTGFILEQEAQEIEAGANAALRAALLSKPKASDAFCVVSRTDNLLSTKNLSAEARVVPLAYPEDVTLTVGLLNPANVIPV